MSIVYNKIWHNQQKESQKQAILQHFPSVFCIFAVRIAVKKTAAIPMTAVFIRYSPFFFLPSEKWSKIKRMPYLPQKLDFFVKVTYFEKNMVKKITCP